MCRGDWAKGQDSLSSESVLVVGCPQGFQKRCSMREARLGTSPGGVAGILGCGQCLR